MSTTKKQGSVSGGQKGAGDVLGQDPGSIQGGLAPGELGAVVARPAAPRYVQQGLQGVWEEEDRQEVAQPVNAENLVIQPVEVEEEEEEEEEEQEQDEEEVEENDDDEEDEEDEDEEDEDKDEEKSDKEDEGEEGEDEEYEDEEYEEEEEEYSYEEGDENYMDSKEGEDGSHDSSLLDLKLGYIPYHQMVSNILSFFNKEATKYKYENPNEKFLGAGCEEEEKDENEETEGGL